MGYVDDRIKKALSAAQAGQSGTTTTGATTGVQSGGYTQDRINRALQSASAAQQAQKRTQTIQSMQTKKAELDERKLGVSYAPAGYSQQPQEQPQYISPAPIVWTLDSAVSPIIKQNSKVSKQYATAMPSAPLIQQATETFGKWNQQYEQDENRYLDNVDRVSTLSGMGTSDPDANRRLEQSSQKLDQTKAQQDAVVRQTLKMLGPGTEEFLKQRLEDAKTKEGSREKWLRANKEHELKQELGSDLYGKLLDYTRRSEQAQKAEAEQEREQREVERKYNAYETLRYNDDFKEKSQYQSTANGEKEDVLTQLLGSGIKDSSSGWDDPLYEAVNGNEEAAAYLEERAANRYQADAGALGAILGRAAEGKQEIKQMTEDEIGMFNYLYATKGKEAAHEYYDFIQSTALNKGQTEEEKKYWEQWSQGHPVKSSIFSVATGPLKMLSYAGQAGDYIGSGKIDENAGYNRFARMNSTIREAVSEKAAEKWGSVGSFLYQTGMSMADFLYNAILTGSIKGEEALGEKVFQIASNASLAIMGTGAAADATIEAKERGLTDTQAFTLGTIAGAAEILTEKFSVEKLLAGKWEGSKLKYILKNAFTEGSEEVGSDVINLVADVLISKDQSKWEQSIREYREGGLTAGQAFVQAMIDQGLEMGLDFLGGALSGGLMSTANVVANRKYWNLQRDMQKAAKQASEYVETKQPQYRTNINITEQQNTQAQAQQDARQNAATTDFAQEQPGLEQTIQEPQAAKAPLSERAQQLAQRMAALGEDGETALELARDMEGYFWGNVTDEATVQRLANNPAAVTVMEQLMDQGIRPNMEAQTEEGQQTAQDQNQPDRLNGPILDTLQELDRQKRAANARNETERTGILAGATTEQIEQAQRIGELVGREVAFFAEGKDASGGLKNGYFNQKDGRIYVNVNSQNPIAQIVSHELTHSVEGNNFYDHLRQTVLKKIKADGMDLDTLRAEKQALYDRHGVTDVDVDAEIVAEYVEKNLLTDEESIRRLVQENRTLGQRIMEFIDKLLAKLGNKKAQEREFLSKARRYYADALAESQSSGTYGQQERVRSMERLQEQMASGELTEEEARQVFDEIYDAELDLQNGLRGNQYSINNTRDLDIREQIKRQRAGEMTKHDEFYYGDTPSVLEMAGLDRKPLVMSQTDFKKSKSEKHNVPPRAMTRLTEKLADPILSFELGDRIGVLTKDIDGDGKPLLVGILKNADLDGESVNRIKSAYGLDAPQAWIKNQIENGGNLRIYDIEKADRFLDGFGYKAEHPENYRSGDIIPNVHKKYKTEFSISEEENLSDLDREQLAALESMKEGTRQAETEQLRQALPVKARQYLARAERVLLANVQNALGVDKFSDKAGLMSTIQEISNEYLKHGKLTQERADALFEKAYKQGIVVEKEFYERYKGIKDKLRTTAVTLDPGYASSIPDVKDFRQAAFGRLRLVKEGGMSVDSLYQELQQQAPELFPADIANPADQLVRMFDVAKSIQIGERNVADSMGRDAQDFKRWAKNDFDAAIADVASELRNVNRYAQERAEEANAEKSPTTPEEAAKAYGDLKKARWTMEKAKAKNLLTDADRMQVGRLLRGEIEISDLKPGKDNVQGIRAVYEASKEYDGLAKQINKYKAQQRQKLQKKAAGYLENALEWKDKAAGIQYSRETMERNIQDIAPDTKTADAVIKEYITPVHKAEAESTRFKNRYRDRVRALDLSQKVQEGNKVSEAYAVQLLGEAQDNIQRIENSKGRMQKRDGETAETWKGIISTLKAENPNLDWAKVENAVAEFRGIYDELFRQANEVRVRNGYEPINYRSGYFPHFQAQGDSFLSKLGHAIGIDTQVQTLPTSINGITGEFKPGITWFKFGQQRKGYQTAYDAVAGFDQYIEGVSSVIHQTDNIQNLRALATEIRRMTGDEGIRQQIDAIQTDRTLTENEKRAKLEDVYKNGQYTLSNFVNELDEYTNLLANKKSKLDRSMEAMIGRRAYTIMKNFESRVGANMVAGNLASAFTNFIPLVQAWGQIDSGTLLHGMWDTLKAYKTDDGFVDQSTFLTNRRGSDPIVQTWAQKASKVAGTPMEYIDNFAADSVVRARFRQNMRRGMSEALAMEEADAFAARVMADRSKGSMPTLFSSNNPFFKAFTQFQLEVNNQFSEVFKDLPRAYKDKGLAALTAALLKYFFGAYIYNEVYEKIVGRRPALDPFGILNDTVGDLTGYELPNLVTMAGNAIQGKKTSFEAEKVGLGEAGKNLTENVLGELPFSSGLALVGIDLDGGRVPASSAIPDLTALWDAATKEDWSGKKRWSETQKELDKLAYILPSFGGNQISKGVKTAKQLMQRGKYTVDAEGNDVLQYPIDNNPGNWIRSAMFGTSSLPESQEYYDSGNKALTGEQTAVVRELEKQGVDQKTTYNLYQTLRKIGKEKSGAEASNAKRDAINALDLSDEQKLKVFAATMLDNKSDKYEETLEQYQGMLDAGLSWDEITKADNMYADLEEERLTQKELAQRMSEAEILTERPRKVKEAKLTSSERARKMELWMDDQDWTEEQQAAAKSHIGVKQAAKGEGAYEYMKERIGNGTPPETVLQALTDAQQENYSKYIQKAKVPAETYLDALSFYSSAKSDKDKDGKTISGSKKQKIVDWIDSQKLTKKQKRALFLCFYSESDDTFK